jgi:hypothetical protein
MHYPLRKLIKNWVKKRLFYRALILKSKHNPVSECWYGAHKIPTSVRAARGRKQFQFCQALLGGIGVQGDEKPFSSLADKKGNRNTEAESAPFPGNGKDAYERDEEPPPACDR